MYNINNSTIVYCSEFDNSVTVMIVYKDSEIYKKSQCVFSDDPKTVAFLIPERKTIMIDGEVFNKDWFTQDHLNIIEAHEIGHLNLGHIGTSKENELQADLFGFQMILETNNEYTISLYRQLIEDRYNIKI